MVLDLMGGPGDAAVEEILALHDGGKVTLLLPYSVKSEIEHPHTPTATKKRAAGFIYTEPVSRTPDELRRHDEIRDLLRGKAQPGKHAKDAFHVVEASKYGSYFVTRDERIIKNRDEIRKRLGLDVVTPEEFLDRYRDAERRFPRT